MMLIRSWLSVFWSTVFETIPKDFLPYFKKKCFLLIILKCFSWQHFWLKVHLGQEADKVCK